MSLRALTHVWRSSKQSGSGLLLHLALADFSDEFGVSFPSIPTLARKARIGERHVQRLLKELVKSGALAIKRGKGPRGTHLFYLNICETEGVPRSHPDNLSEGLQVNEG
jgi:Helix-turn-helix domain